MRNIKLIISFALVFSMVFSVFIFPVGAADDVKTKFFDWWASYSNFPDWFIDGVAEELGIEKPVDHLHSWQMTGMGTSGGNTISSYRCTICGADVDCTNDLAQNAYNKYVEELPATGYDSEGGLLFTARHKNFSSSYYGGTATYRWSCDHSVDSSSFVTGYCVFHPYCSLNTLVITPISGQSQAGIASLYFYFSLEVPYDGYYSLIDSPAGHFSYTRALSSGTASYEYNTSWSAGNPFYYTSGSSFTAASSFSCSSSPGADGLSFYEERKFSYFSGSVEPPVYRFTPVPGASTDFDLTYAPSTRVTNITGDVAYYDVNGTLQLAPNVNIVNEGSKTFYNPVTNMTHEINNWSYDYSDRSYTLELNTGDTVNVTYGDEYIRIQEGDTVYNVYYVTNNTTPPLTHTHEWYQSGATQPTCTEYGQKVYTCSTCGEQKTELLPALGHDWVQSGSVDAVYDEDGSETEPAYVLYVCSRCGEEYRDYDGAGPPAPPEPPPSEDDSSGILAWLKEFKVWLGEKLDSLIGGGDTEINNDYNITYIDEDGEEQDINIKSIADKFAWWKQVADIGQTFVSQVAASEAAAYAYAADGARAGPTGAPSIPLDLSLAQSYYGVDYGGEIEMLDLSWYTPYKKTVDDLISGFMWLFFLWSLFKRFPAIIAGEGLVESRLSELRSSGSGSYSSSGVPLLPSKRKGR